MTYQEKVKLIVLEILDAQKLVPSKRHYTTLCFGSGTNLSKINARELYGFLKKFEVEGAFKIIPTDGPDLAEELGVPNVEADFVIIEETEDFSNWAKKKIQECEQIDRAHWIDFNESTREIWIDGTKKLHKVNFDRENFLVFELLYKHPEVVFTKDTIGEEIEDKVSKKLSKIVDNLGFKYELRKMFFSVSRDSICFHNPISQKKVNDLKKQGYDIPDNY